MILETSIKQASKILKKNKISTHYLDAEIILSDLMGVEREFLTINRDKVISNELNHKYLDAIKRRLKGEPVAYITGKKEFWSHNFSLNRSTLVPRPETELMIYKIVKFFKNKKISILDIGTGSGCILLSILTELSCARGVGIDILPKAIKMAQVNSKKHGLANRSSFKVFDFCKFYSHPFDLIVSNPPYIPTKDLKNLSKDIINYEPLTALNGGIDGLDLIKKVIYKSHYLLKKNGLLALEIGNQQYKMVTRLLKRSGFREIGKEFDYNYNVRCIISTKI